MGEKGFYIEISTFTIKFKINLSQYLMYINIRVKHIQRKPRVFLALQLSQSSTREDIYSAKSQLAEVGTTR